MSDDQKHCRCEGCKKAYDEDKQKPLLLPCGHACCRQCASSMEDRSDTHCPFKNCKQDWGSKNLSDLKTVYDLIPGTSKSKGERQVTPAPSSGGACGTVSQTGTGREVEPMAVDQDDDAKSVVSVGKEKQLSVTECPVCMEEYNGNESRPVLLTCGHASCLSCLQILEKENCVRCPRCRKIWPKGALENFPVVKSLVRPKNWVKKNPDKKKSPFSVCKRADEVAKEWISRSKASAQEKKMEIYVETGRGTHTVHADPERDTVADVASRLPGGSSSCNRFSFGGRTLQNDRPLADFNVRPHSTIRETPRLTGGSQF